LTNTAIKLLITDEGYRAIGHVAAQWAYLETELDCLLSLLSKHEKAEKLELPNAQSFKNRMTNLREVSKALLENQEKPLDEIIDIITDASSLRGFRDDIIHGQWKLHRKGPVLTPGIIATNRYPSYKVRKMKFTYKKAEEVAAKISRVTLRVIAWRLNYVKFE
jgi:hypothetical protein